MRRIPPWRRRLAGVWLSLWTAAWAVSTSAQTPPSARPARLTPPVIDAPIVDPSDRLDAREERMIAETLVAHRRAHGVQMAVLVIDSTGGEPIEDFAHRAAVAWGGGSAERDDGVLFVLAIADRRMRLEVGYGLEAQLPDASARRILDRAIPALRRGTYGRAVEGVVDEVIARTGDAPPPSLHPPGHEHDAPVRERSWGWTFWYLVVLCAGILVGSRRRREHMGRPDVGGPPRIGLVGWVEIAAALLVLPAVLGLFGMGWMHNLAALLGIVAGWRFAGLDAPLTTLGYVLFSIPFGVVPYLIASAATRDGALPILVMGAAQGFLSFVFGQKRGGAQGVSFSSTGADSAFADGTLMPRGWDTPSPSSPATHDDAFGASTFDGGASFDPGPSFDSFDDWSGGGGDFGGGGASSSW